MKKRYIFVVTLVAAAGACSAVTNKPQVARAPAPVVTPLAQKTSTTSPSEFLQPREKSRPFAQHQAVAALRTNEIRPTNRQVGPARLYPNPDLTKGKAATKDVKDLTKKWTDHCPAHKANCTYSQDHRDVSTKDHAKVYDEYNVPKSKRNIKSGEVDHLYPLCAGGSNDLDNLWYQPITNTWNGENLGFKEKDRLETFVCKEISRGKLDPKDAYDKITTDWVAFYHDTFGDSTDDSEAVDDDR